ncbi:MAG: Holliday junction branch migration protein RuvA [Clostridia bacterium]|nr:Holliday junction branch migration protein RuvA [Clostridia bacterium]
MYYSLNGTLLHKELGLAVIDCGGVGYKCFCSLNTLKALGEIGSPAFVFTYLAVREDALDLYGFATQDELSCFKLLLTVSGVGGKAALAILSELSTSEFALCVAAGDHKRLQKAQGVGAKIAQRIVVDLKEKVGGVSGADTTFVESVGNATAAGSNSEEAISALTVLGYSRADAASAVAKLDPATSVEDMIRAALKTLAGSR